MADASRKSPWGSESEPYRAWSEACATPARSASTAGAGEYSPQHSAKAPATAHATNAPPMASDARLREECLSCAARQCVSHPATARPQPAGALPSPSNVVTEHEATTIRSETDVVRRRVVAHASMPTTMPKHMPNAGDPQTAP